MNWGCTPSALFYIQHWDSPFQTAADRTLRTFFPARVPPRKIWLLCVHSWLAGSLRRWLFSWRTAVSYRDKTEEAVYDWMSIWFCTAGAEHFPAAEWNTQIPFYLLTTPEEVLTKWTLTTLCLTRTLKGPWWKHKLTISASVTEPRCTARSCGNRILFRNEQADIKSLKLKNSQ